MTVLFHCCCPIALNLYLCSHELAQPLALASPHLRAGLSGTARFAVVELGRGGICGGTGAGALRQSRVLGKFRRRGFELAGTRRVARVPERRLAGAPRGAALAIGWLTGSAGTGGECGSRAGWRLGRPGWRVVAAGFSSGSFGCVKLPELRHFRVYQSSTSRPAASVSASTTSLMTY